MAEKKGYYSFDELARRFVSSIYWLDSWRRCRETGDLTEGLIYDFIRSELQVFPSSMAQFHVLVTAMILVLEAPRPHEGKLAALTYLRTVDPDEDLNTHMKELEEYRRDMPTDLPNWQHAVKFWMAATDHLPWPE